MVGFKININERDVLNAINSRMDLVADKIFAKSQQNIIDKGIIDEGTLLKSGNINREFLSKEIVYPVPYAEEIEFGRTPGTEPPFQAIADWVKRKGLAKKENAIYKITKNIVEDIKKNGKEPRPFMTPAIQAVRSELSR